MSDRGSPDSPTFVDGIGRLASRYDAFILDQWGVLHDGVSLYPAAAEAMEQLKQRGKRVVILSNSGRRAADNSTLLARLGIPADRYELLMSAGDDARDAIVNDPDPFYRTLGRRCFLFARDGETDLVDGLPVDLTDDIADADFLLVLSMDPHRQSLAKWRTLLEQALALDLPMVCGNPDTTRVTPSGELLEAPGLLGETYAAMGGTVRFHGKPEQRIYRRCLDHFGLSRDRVLAIGDSIHHDVRGAQRAGVDSLLVVDGIHKDELTSSGCFDPARAENLYARMAARPRYVATLYRW